MAGQLAIGVLPEQPGFDFDPGKSVTLCTETGDFFVGESVPNGQGIKAFGFFTQTLEATAVFGLDVHQFGQRVDGGFQVFHFGGGDLQGVGRVVVGQHDAIAVQNVAAWWHRGQDGRAVAFGLRHQVIVADDLQINQPRGQQAKAQQNHPLEDDNAGLKAVNLGAGVAQFRKRRQVQ